MSKFGVSEKKFKALVSRMRQLGIKESDLDEKFIRSGGKGGQNVNKVATCVYIKHIPTGFEVKCERERTQSLNRFFARRMIADKVERTIDNKMSEEKKRIAKIRRQKRKRSKRAKEKILENKKKQSEKKNLRKKVNI